jgi:putative membrane protein
MIRYALIAVACGGLAACASSDTATMAAADTGMAIDAAAAAPASPMAYVAAAGASDMFEIQSSQVALQKSTNPDVKAFAQMMVDHHTKTTADLMAAAKQAGLNPPPPALPADKARMIAALQSASPGAFNEMYMKGQVAGHEEALAIHTGYADKGDSAPLKAAAAKTAPIVSSHLERARTIAQQRTS